MPHVDISGYLMNSQPAPRLPVELLGQIWTHIFSGKPSPDDPDDRKTLLTLSLSTRHFRSLALPYLFRSFSPLYRVPDGRPCFNAFCRAWTSGDKSALALTHHIRHCTLDVIPGPVHVLDGAVLLERTEAYLAAFLALPNLSSLKICAAVKLSLLQQLLESKTITSISFFGSMGYTDDNPLPEGPSNLNSGHYDGLAKVVATYAKDARSLSISTSRLSEFLPRLQPSFRLTTLRIHRGKLPEMELLRRFFSAMPTLKELSLERVRLQQDIRFEPGDLSNLESLTCDTQLCFSIITSAKLTKLRSLVIGSDLGDTYLPDGGLLETFHVITQTNLSKSLRAVRIPADLADVFCASHTPYLEELTIHLTDYSIFLHAHAGLDVSLASLASHWARTVGYGKCNNGDKGDQSSGDKAGIWANLTSFSFNYLQDWFRPHMHGFMYDLVEQRRDIALLQNRFPSICTVKFSELIIWDRLPAGEWVPQVVVAHKRTLMDRLSSLGDDWHDMDYAGCLEQLATSEPRQSCTSLGM